MRRSSPIPSRRRRGAFTVLEVLIALAILLAIAGVTLPALLTRGLDDPRADLIVRLNASLLDAQREALRSGETTRLVWRQPSTPDPTDRAPLENTATLVIERLPNTTADETSFAERLGETLDDRWIDTPPEQDSGEDAADAGPDLDDSLSATVAYVLPDGTLVAGEEGLVLELNGAMYLLGLEPVAFGATLTELSEEDLLGLESGASLAPDDTDPESMMSEFDDAFPPIGGAP